MPYLLDGDNLVGTERRRRPASEDRDALVSEISERLRRTGARVVLFFDGAGRTVSLGSLAVRYAGSVSADEAILREVARDSRPAETTVVTADRDLARRARDLGAAALSPPDFWKRFGTGVEPKRPSREGPVNVEDWLDWFSDDSNRNR
jgi:predicted RNA-binding protein with PIN domain